MKLVTSLAVASIAFFPVAANALQVTINSVSGSWSAVTGGGSPSGIGTNTLSWGVPSNSGGEQSSYVFDGVAPPVAGPFDAGVIFDLGEFTHNNYTITAAGGSITGAQLAVTVNGTLGSSQNFTLTSFFDFAHNETDNNPSGYNNCSFGGDEPCPDIVTPTNHVFGSDTIDIGGVEYMIAVTGFDGIGSHFQTLEGKSNDATLQATFTTKASVVPVPAGLPLLVSALGLVGFVARRRRRAA